MDIILCIAQADRSGCNSSTVLHGRGSRWACFEDVIRQRVAGRALQGSYGAASAFSVDKCARKCGSASADFAIRFFSPLRLSPFTNLYLVNELSLL